jgi:CheY-like chemotaxis protein
MNSAAPLRPQKAGPVNRTMLHIEDYAVTRRLVEQMLLNLRPQVELHVATNARDGVKAAIDERPALILLDNRLPTPPAAKSCVS